MHRVMIVDDHDFILESLKYSLESDYIVNTANSGNKCIEQAKTFNPDVVMVDFKMHGLDGLEVTEQLMNTKRPPAIIMISACMDDDLEKEAMNKGVVECMSKPFDLDELKYKIHQAILDKE